MKTECAHCGGQIEFGDDSAGADVVCPHCQQETRLEPGYFRRAPKQLASGSGTSWTVVPAPAPPPAPVPVSAPVIPRQIVVRPASTAAPWNATLTFWTGWLCVVAACLLSFASVFFAVPFALVAFIIGIVVVAKGRGRPVAGSLLIIASIIMPAVAWAVALGASFAIAAASAKATLEASRAEEASLAKLMSIEDARLTKQTWGGEFSGRVRNKSDKTVKSVIVVVEYLDASDQFIDTKTFDALGWNDELRPTAPRHSR